MGDGDATIRVGYALPPKKIDTLITPSLINFAQQRGIHLISIDPNKPLIDQGPFQCLLHKIYSHDWNLNLLDFQSKNPNVPIIDSPLAIQRIQNRISMLDFIHNLPTSPFSNISFDTPLQIVVDGDNGGLLNDSDALSKLIPFPVVAKPLFADGSANSHEMSLVFNAQAASRLRPPVVLQEFVNHGGVVFKVYVAGNHVECVKRRSLRDVSPEMESRAKEGGVLSFSQISNMADDGRHGDCCIEQAEMPPVEFVEFMGRNMRQALGLNLFNFDMIRDCRVSKSAGDGIRYFVIDINYFPGYAKLPDYESFTDFLCDVVKLARDDKDANLQHDGDGDKGQVGNTTV